MIDPNDPYRKVAPSLIVFSLLGTGMIVAALASGGITIAVAVMHHLNPDDAMKMLNADAPYAVRSFVRVSQGLTHLFLFVAAAVFAIWGVLRAYYLEKPYHNGALAHGIRSYFNLDISPRWKVTLLGVLLVVLSAPMVQYSYLLNKALPLADWMRTLETQTADAIKGLLIMDSPFELLANLLVIAVLPGVGEELVFRGIVQPQFGKLSKNPWYSIVITALLFSAVHLQFEGFLPRFLLGMVLGWLYFATKNLWVPILAHVFNNGIQVLMMYFYKAGMTEVNLEQDYQVPWYAALISLGLVLGLAYLINQQTKNTIPEPPDNASEPQKSA
jgi:uncharacterized protein